MSAWPLDRTVFVEAGAGTGKTSALVDRVLALVRADHPMRGIAAITFTEAAASQLRARIRTALVDAGEQAAVDQLDEATISTLHGFAQRILAEHPFEAGLPPTVDVLDEIQSTLAFDDRWAVFVDQLFADSAYETVLLRATALRFDFDNQLRQVALIFNDHWDRLGTIELSAPTLSAVDPAAVAAHLRQAAQLAQHCRDDTDKLLAHVAIFEGLPERLLEADDELELLHLLNNIKSFEAGNAGKAANYDGCSVDDVKAALREAEAARAALLADVRAEVLDHLLVAVRRFVLAAAEQRRVAGRLEFHDLLVRARDVVRDHAEVRAALGERYSHLLIDEFQDTDPLQVDLVTAIAGDTPGKLFFVGDAKQSIYRFRRADIALYERMRTAMELDDVKSLTDNYRSVPGIVDWVNHAFTELIGAGVEQEQAAYNPLAATRTAARKADTPVVKLGGEHPKGVAIAAVREEEADEIAHTIDRLHNDGDVALKEIAVLMPTRTSLPQLERALDAAEIPYRVASASLVWATQEVRDLLAVLRVIDDPSDQLALVGALRSPVLACADDDLLTYRQAGGAWHLHAPAPAALAPEHPVAAGLALLRSLHAQRWWTGLSGMVERVLRELRFFELAVAHPRPRDRWRRLRWVLDQARAFEADGAGSLREFLAWAELQAEENTRVREAAAPDADDDAVLIYTVHGAKGLEFDTVILTGLNRAPISPASQATVHWGPDRPEVKTWRQFRSLGFDALDQEEKVMDRHERMRLLYVAATRARDLLIVSVHRKYNDRDSHAAQLARVGELRPDLWRDAGPRQLILQSPPSQSAPSEPADAAARRRQWEADRTAQIDALAAVRVRAATAIAAGVTDADHEVDLDAPPWKKGRAGTSVGRAVHATLQTVDLATGDGLDSIVAAQATAEGVDDRRADVQRAARAALDSDSVRDAVASGRYWRELYVAAPVGDVLVEGFVDLLYESADGLVVVDYKTDAVRTPADVEAAVGRYRLQGATYALAVEHTTKRPVAAVRFVFTTGGTAVEREVTDLRAAIADVAALL